MSEKRGIYSGSTENESTRRRRDLPPRSPRALSSRTRRTGLSAVKNQLSGYDDHGWTSTYKLWRSREWGAGNHSQDPICANAEQRDIGLLFISRNHELAAGIDRQIRDLASTGAVRERRTEDWMQRAGVRVDGKRINKRQTESTNEKEFAVGGDVGRHSGNVDRERRARDRGQRPFPANGIYEYARKALIHNIKEPRAGVDHRSHARRPLARVLETNTYSQWRSGGRGERTVGANRESRHSVLFSPEKEVAGGINGQLEHGSQRSERGSRNSGQGAVAVDGESQNPQRIGICYEEDLPRRVHSDLAGTFERRDRYGDHLGEHARIGIGTQHDDLLIEPIGHIKKGREGCGRHRGHGNRSRQPQA